MADEKIKVLLVEDDPFMVTILQEQLKKEGFDLTYAGTGEDAVNAFSASRPDIMLLDIILPKKSGLEALQDIRALPGGATLPVIILSNLEESNYVTNAENLGVSAYLIKANVQVSEIIAKVREILRK